MSLKPHNYGYKLGGSKKWIRTLAIRYISPRYGRWVIVPVGYESDGATGALDVPSNAWWVHDKLCDDGCWHDGVKVTRWQASMVLHDILRSEARCEGDILKRFRAKYWFLATYYFGCFRTKRRWFWERKGDEQ